MLNHIVSIYNQMRYIKSIYILYDVFQKYILSITNNYFEDINISKMSFKMICYLYKKSYTVR